MGQRKCEAWEGEVDVLTEYIQTYGSKREPPTQGACLCVVVATVMVLLVGGTLLGIGLITAYWQQEGQVPTATPSSHLGYGLDTHADEDLCKYD